VSAVHIVVIVVAVAGIGLCTWAAPRRYHLQRSKSQHHAPRALTVPEPLTEAEYEAIKTRWLALYGSNTMTPLCGEHDVNEWACVFNPRTARMEHYKRAWTGCRVDFAGSSCDGAKDPLGEERPDA
jgi:hypothetical protein